MPRHDMARHRYGPKSGGGHGPSWSRVARRSWTRTRSGPSLWFMKEHRHRDATPPAEPTDHGTAVDLDRPGRSGPPTQPGENGRRDGPEPTRPRHRGGEVRRPV